MSYVGFPSPTPVFPALPVQGFPVSKKPFFTSWQHRSVTGKQFQCFRQVYPNWDFELQYGDMAWLREQTQNQQKYQNNSPFTEFEAMSQLFLACYGSYGDFFYDDPEDDSRFAQPIATGDGSTTQFRVVRTWGLVGPTARIEPVGGVNLGLPITVYLNGSPVAGSTYSVTNDPSGSHLTFTSAPGGGVAITMDFFYYYRCRWLEPNQQYDQFLYNLWQLGKAKFRSVKP